MKHLRTYKLFENNELLNNFNKYSFDKLIKQNKNNIKENGLNVKAMIHKACAMCLDESAHIFMFEIAMIETGLGVSSKSKATRGDIGRSLWHVDKGTFEETKKPHARTNKALENLKKNGLDWSKVDWNDISENVYFGAVACKLVLLKKGMSYSNSQQLNSRENRSKKYSKRYNGGGTPEAAKNYLKNTIGWYNTLLQYKVEILEFRGKKYNVTQKGLMLNNKLV